MLPKTSKDQAILKSIQTLEKLRDSKLQDLIDKLANEESKKLEAKLAYTKALEAERQTSQYSKELAQIQESISGLRESLEVEGFEKVGTRIDKYFDGSNPNDSRIKNIFNNYKERISNYSDKICTMEDLLCLTLDDLCVFGGIGSQSKERIINCIKKFSIDQNKNTQNS
jgi:DNA repair exonuclease SbcCD ATPase subunit